MKKIWQKIKRPICGVIMAVCLFLLLGCTGTCERGGDLITYVIQGSILLTLAIAAGIIGDIMQ